jgi:GNAT superfamily N-acetyltransferase
MAALRTELERSGVTVPPRLAKPTLVDEVTALRGGASVDEIGARLNPPTGARPVPIRDLFDADDATVEAALRDVYEGQFGPYTTKVTVQIRRAGTRTDSRGRVHRVDASIGVDGEIFDAAGRKIGYFGRSISEGNLHYADGRVRREVWADHATVQLEPRFQGKGFGAAFNQRAIEWYRASGVHGISLSDHNGYVWASQGFGFAMGKVPEHTVTALRSFISDLRAGRTKDQFGVAIPKALREASDLDAQLAIAEDVLRRATTLQPGATGYPTARELSQIGRTTQRGKTSTWLGKHFMFNNGSTSELVLNPDEGVVIS